MTDTSQTPPPQSADKKSTPPPLPPKPPSLRSGTPKEIAMAAYGRKTNNYGPESFASYLTYLSDDQSSIYKKKRPRQETLNQQMDILDAMFTYLAIHADWKEETPLSYSAALRAQKQFCATLKDVKNLKLPKPPSAPLTTFPLGQK